MSNYFNFIDLHTHSTASDGSETPAKVAELAKAAGLSAIALTDHDTMSGAKECFLRGKELGLDVIPGVEMGCVYKEREIHILGYLLPQSLPQGDLHIADSIFSDLEFFAKERAERNKEIIRRFAADGIYIAGSDLNPDNANTQITRAHFANALIRLGLVNTKSAAFSRYLEYGGRYIPVKTITAERCMEFLNRHAFFISLAHPLQYHFSNNEVEELILYLKALGLSGVEVYHSSHNIADVHKLMSITKRNNLLPTGGSDFHGSNKEGLDIGTGYGGLRVPHLLLDDMINSRRNL